MRVKTLSKDQARAYYDRFGSKQDSQGYYEDPATEDMVSHAQFSMAHSVFEYGCGTGRFAESLLEDLIPSTVRYLGIDISPSMVELARTRLSRFASRAEVRVTDGSLPVAVPSGGYDRFVSNYVLDLLSERDIEEVLREAQRILQVGGLLCLVSLSNGSALGSRFVARLLATVNALRPALIGGCRPINLLNFISSSEWEIRYTNQVAPYGIPSEVIVAVKK